MGDVLPRREMPTKFMTNSAVTAANGTKKDLERARDLTRVMTSRGIDMIN